MKKDVNCNPNNDPNYVSVEEMAGSILRRPDSPGLDFSAGNPSFGELIVIAGTKLEKIEYAGLPVITLSMVARAHQKPLKMVWQNFKRNIDRFILGEDYVILPYEKWSALVSSLRGYQTEENLAPKGGHRGEMILLYLSGYLMLAKTFTDDLSWNVQRELVNVYFSTRKIIAAIKDKVIELQGKVIDAYEREAVRRERRANKFSEVELTRMVEMANNRYTIAEISNLLQRSRTTIQDHMRKARQAGLIIYDAAQASFFPEVR
jgi:hypothetical protein